MKARNGQATVALAAALLAALPFGFAQAPAPADAVASGASVALEPAGAGAEPETSVAAAAPTSVPIAPKRVEYALPFSLSDCYSMLSTARKALQAQAAGQAEYDMDSIVDLLETVTNYLRDRDAMHTNLIDYEWQILTTRAVNSATPQTETIMLDPREDGKDIVALSFEVDGADATIHTLEVYSHENELVGPFRNEVTLRHSLPRRYVFHLYRPTRVARIVLTTSQARPGSESVPRVVINAGRTDQPEPGKGAIHFIWRAQLALRGEDYDKAQRRLELAQDEILEYRRMLRSD
jgi:hypothetical protein